ncbi:unnamed protein product [Closterium sp. NIES-54]
MSDLGFQPCSADPSPFVRRGSTPFFVLFYVDDLVFATADRVALADVKREVQKRHTGTDLSELRHYLGLQITSVRAACTITLSQLIGPFFYEPFEPSGPYAELVGCLMVAKYIATTSGVGLVLGGRQSVVLTGHCDSSYADDVESHRSTQGYCFSLGSGVVSWRSTRSSSVSTSTAEAKIYAGAMAAQELHWLTFLLTDLGLSAPPLGPLITAATAAPEYCTTMASIRVLEFDHEGRLVAFDTWHDDLQLYLQSDIKDSVSLFDHVSGVAPAPPATADGSTHSQWLSRDATARLAICNHLLVAEWTHFGQQRTAQTLTAPAEALHTFTLDSGASRCFFRDSTTLTPLPAPVPVRLADPSGGPVVASSSTVLPCPTVPSGSLSGLHLPLLFTNLVSTAALRDAMVTTTTPGGQRVSICTCTRTGRHLATFTHRPGSSLHTLATGPPQVATSAQVSVSGQVAASCSCRLLMHQTLLWHHCLGHPSLPRLRGMHSRFLVSGLPRSLPPLPPSPAPPCLPCVEGWQRAAPHSSSFPPTTAPLQTLHMDVWGPARVSGQGRERYFLLVVDDYTRYTTAFPLRSKGEVPEVLIPWIRTVRLQLCERFGTDLPVLRLHSDRGGDFSCDLLRDFCRGEGILQSFTLPDSPQQNGIAECRIGLFMEVARTSMIHVATPHFLWPFAVRYAAHQLNLWPRVSLPETSPKLRWTGKVGDASVFRVWGSRALVRDTSADKLSARAILCVFLGFVHDAPGWQLYHPTSRRVLPSQDVTLDESVPLYRLFPNRSAPPPPPPLFLAPGPPPVDPLPPQGPAPSGVSQVDPLPGTVPVRVAVGSGAAPGVGSGGAASRGAEPGGVGSEGAGSGGAEPGGAELKGAESGGAEPQGAASSGGPAGSSPRLSSQHLREWLVRRAHRRSGAPGAGGARDTGAGGAAVPAGAGGTGGTATTGPGGARTSGAGAAGTGGVGTAGAGDPTEPGAAGAGSASAGGAGVGGPGIGGAGAAGVGAVDPGARGAGGTVRPRPYFVPLLQQVLGVLSSTGLPSPFLFPPPDQSQPPLQPASPLPAPSPYTEQSGGLTERREPASRPASPVRTARRTPCSRPPPVPGTHTMALRPSSVPLHVPLPAPPESSLLEVPELASNSARTASPTVACLLATAVTDPSFEYASGSALVAELLDFATACRLDYATALVAESVSASPPSVGGECALGMDVLEDRHEDFECLAAAVPRFASMLLAPEGDPDAPDIPTPRSYAEAITGTYVDEVPPSRANIVDGMWIFRGVDYFETFSPTPKMTTLQVLLHVAAQRDYELHSLDFSTAFLKGNLHKEIWLRRPPGFTGTFPAGTQWSLRRPVYGLRQVPREWHDTLRTTLAALGFAPSTADPSLFLRTDTSLPPFYVLVYVDDLVFATADTEALTLVKSELQKRHTCTDLGRGLVVLTGHVDASWVDDSATQRSSQGYTFSLAREHSFVLSHATAGSHCGAALAAMHCPRSAGINPAVNWLLEVLPAAVMVLKEYKAVLYEVVTLFKFQWLIRFLADVLWELNHLNQRFQQRQINVTLVVHIVLKTRLRLETRYSLRDPAGHFGAGEKMQLPEFIKNHQLLEKREMKAEGVDAEGTPVSFDYTMHERPLHDHEMDGDITACIELSLKFVKAVDAELKWRMRNLHLLEGLKLFRTTSYLPDDAKRVEAFKKWLGQLHKLYSNKLPDEFVC